MSEELLKTCSLADRQNRSYVLDQLSENHKVYLLRQREKQREQATVKWLKVRLQKEPRRGFWQETCIVSEQATCPQRIYKSRSSCCICQSWSITHNFQAMRAMVHTYRLSATGSMTNIRDKTCCFFLLLAWFGGLGCWGFFAIDLCDCLQADP